MPFFHRIFYKFVQHKRGQVLPYNFQLYLLANCPVMRNGNCFLLNHRDRDNSKLLSLNDDIIMLKKHAVIRFRGHSDLKINFCWKIQPFFQKPVRIYKQYKHNCCIRNKYWLYWFYRKTDVIVLPSFAVISWFAYIINHVSNRWTALTKRHVLVSYCL